MPKHIRSTASGYADETKNVVHNLSAQNGWKTGCVLTILSKYCTQGHVTPRVLPPYDDSSKALFWLVSVYLTESIRSSSFAITKMYSHILIQTQINHQHPRVRLRLPTPSSSNSTRESRAVLARLHKIGRRSCYKSAKIDRNFRLFWEILPVTK